MALPPPMPLYRRLTIFVVLLLVLIGIAAFRGAVPMFQRWAGEWKTQAR